MSALQAYAAVGANACQAPLLAILGFTHLTPARLRELLSHVGEAPMPDDTVTKNQYLPPVPPAEQA